MVLPSVDNFLKILRFYQLNSIKSVKDLSKKAYQYNTIDKFYNSLNYNYDQGSEGLTYPTDQNAIQYAINSRLDLANYLNNAGFPGSYAYNTPDGYMIKQLILDWASVIKTFQDSTERITNAYLLSSEEVDKAIRGFGIDFINSRTVPSLDRRQTFLLNMCELYKIKGSPDSIIKALNIIGLDDIYIQECWVYPTRDGQKNIEIKWIPVYQQQSFNNIENRYEDPNDNLQTEYWTWGNFEDELAKIDECHWFYTKKEIIDLNWNNDNVTNYVKTFIHLPSITPYFNVKIKFDNDSEYCQLTKIYDKLKDQIRIYLNNIDLPKDCEYEGYSSKLSFLDIWCGFIYTLQKYWDYVNFYSLKKYISRYGLFKIDYDSFVSNTTYFDLIYKLYTIINSYSTNTDTQKNLQNIVDFYVPVASPLRDLSYNYIKYWWISNKHTEDDDTNGLSDIKKIIYPSKINSTVNSNYVEVFWNEDYNYGYYDVEIFLNNKWQVLEQNSQVKCEVMQRVLCLVINGNSLNYNNVDQLYEKIRIVHYRTENNIPDIFFRKPFYVSYQNRDTDMDMIFGFNSKMLHDTVFENELFHALYEDQNTGIVSNYTNEELYKQAVSLIYDKKVRITDRDLFYKVYCNSLFQYPNSILKEDRNSLYRNNFFRYIIEPTYNYINYIEHDGENLNYYNIKNRYPQNSKWNYAISYGKDTQTTYYFINYETLRWCRIKGGQLFSDENVSINTINSNGVPYYKDGKVYIKVCDDQSNKNFFVIDSEKCIYEDKWNALTYCKKQYTNNSLIKDFADECKLDYTIEDNLITMYVPPSDIYPSCIIEDVMYDHKYGEKYFTFSDGMIKPDSRLAKNVVEAKIDLNLCETIYENVVDCDNISRYDNNSSNDIQATTIITMYKDPFGSNTQVTYTYLEFLNYMYKSGLSLDRNTGYIYKKFNYYLDENNYLYIKCINLDENKYEDIYNYKWIRVKVSRQWENNEDRKSIFYELDENNNYVIDLDGKRVSNYRGSDYTPELIFENCYDAERYLSDYCVKDGDFSSLPDSCNNVLCLENGTFNCYVKHDVYDSDCKYVKEKELVKYTSDHKKLNYGAKLNTPLIKNVNFGINQDFLDYINSLFTRYGISAKEIKNVILQLSECINTYTKNNLGVSVSLDIYNSHVFESRLILNIINFYKPKRDRMLKLLTGIELDDKDFVFGDGTNDLNYNKLDYKTNATCGFDKYNQKETGGIANQLQVVKQEINDYVPFNDLIYINREKQKTEVNSCREIYPYENSNIENLEVWDRVVNARDYATTVDKSVVNPSFYVSSIDKKINGFYYSKDGNYYMNTYVFRVKDFVFTSKYNKQGELNPEEQKLYVNIRCWCILTKSTIDTTSPYKCLYVSTEDISTNPWLNADGEPMKYQKVNATDNDTFLLNYCKSDFDFGIFQVPEYGDKGEVDNSYIKINLRILEPCFYMSNFDIENYNGFYYCDDQSRFNMPVYKNKHGKMITYFDLSYLPDTYLDFCIKEYHKDNCNRYWIACDYKQIPDIFEAQYIAYCDNNNSVFEYKDSVQTGLTKTFYKCKLNHNTYDKDLLFISGVYGWTISELYGHPEYINRVHYLNKNFKYESAIIDDSEIDSDVHYGDKAVDRRISQNILPEKYTPISYINFNFGNGLMDRYNDVTDCYIKNNDGTKQKLYKDVYTYDSNYFNNGAVIVKEDQSIIFMDVIPLTEKTVVYKYRKTSGEDTFWHTYIERIEDGVCNLYIDGKLVVEGGIATLGVKIDGPCVVCEYGIFDQLIPEWYYQIICKYGIYRFRPEPKKEFNIKSSKNYTPLFCIEMPRTIFGKFMTGLPEAIEGDRVSSKYVDYMGNVFVKHYGIDIINTLDGYKWNAQCRYYPNKPSEISSLWSRKVASRIYDKKIDITGESATIYKRSNGHIKYYNEQGDRLYIDPLYDVENRQWYSEREKTVLVNGIEMKIPSNYVLGDIPIWWTGNREDFKTGTVDHKPVYIAVREKIDDPYPTVKHGRRCGEYFDYDQMFDGPANGNDEVYATTEFDDNTKYLNTLNKFSSDICDSTTDVKLHGVKLEFNSGTDYCCPCYNMINFTSIYDPDTQNLTKEMKDNLIYHKTLLLDKNVKYLLDISGEYTVSNNIPFKDECDMDYCYTSVKSTSNFEKFYKIEKGIITDKRWNNGKKTDKTIKLMSNDIVVPVYNISSNHYLWEVRRIDSYLISEKYINSINYTYDMMVCYSKKIFKMFNVNTDNDMYNVSVLIDRYNILIKKINDIKLTQKKYTDMNILKEVKNLDDCFNTFEYLMSYFSIIDKWLVHDDVEYYCKKIFIHFDIDFNTQITAQQLIDKMNICVEKAKNDKRFDIIKDDLLKITTIDELYHDCLTLSVFFNIYEPFKYEKITDIIGYDGKQEYKYLYCVKQRNVLTNFIKNRYIKSNENKEYDFINRLQLDICGQPLCNYIQDSKEFLSKDYYSYLKQNIVSKTGFRNYSTVRFIPKDEIKITKHASYDMYYYDGTDLYVNVNGDSYGPFKLSKNQTIPSNLEDIICNINCVYTKDNCYVRTQDNEWISVQFERGFIEEYNSMYQTFFVNNNVYVNVPYTNPELEEWSYYVDEKDIMSTMRRFKELNNLGTSQYNHYGEEFPPDKMDEFYCGFLNKQTITDEIFLQFYQVCALDKDLICFKKNKSQDDMEKYFSDLVAVDVNKPIGG